MNDATVIIVTSAVTLLGTVANGILGLIERRDARNWEKQDREEKLKLETKIDTVGIAADKAYDAANHVKEHLVKQDKKIADNVEVMHRAITTMADEDEQKK